MWILVTSSWTKIDATVVTALYGIALILTGVLSWEDVKGERTGWIFSYGTEARCAWALHSMKPA